MTTITPELKTKIERRARRAWNSKSAGASKRVHRVSDVTDTSLNYRLPYTPDYYGSEKVVVLLNPDGSLTVDPKTAGLLDFLFDDDVKRLKKHGDKIRAYALTKADAKAGKTGIFSKGELKVGDVLDLKTGIEIISRASATNKVIGGDRVFVVEVEADDVDFSYGDVRASQFTVVDELDPVKDLGFTTGLLDCQTKSDVESLNKKKHTGRIRAYKYTTKDAESPIHAPKIKYTPGQTYEIKDADTSPSSQCHKGINVADAAWCKQNGKGDSRVFAFEFDMADIAALPASTDGKFRLHRGLCVEEVDPKTFKPLDPPPAAPADQDKPEKGFLGRIFGG